MPPIRKADLPDGDWFCPICTLAMKAKPPTEEGGGAAGVAAAEMDPFVPEAPAVPAMAAMPGPY